MNAKGSIAQLCQGLYPYCEAGCVKHSGLLFTQMNIRRFGEHGLIPSSQVRLDSAEYKPLTIAGSVFSASSLLQNKIGSPLLCATRPIKLVTLALLPGYEFIASGDRFHP